MNTENMKAWVAALRSGEYKQGRSCLRSADGTFCCLGVACDVYAKGHGVGWILEETAEEECLLLGEPAVLPEEVVEWLGMDSSDPHVYNGESCTLANDTLELSFAEIADLLEARYLSGGAEP